MRTDYYSWSFAYKFKFAIGPIYILMHSWKVLVRLIILNLRENSGIKVELRKH